MKLDIGDYPDVPAFIYGITREIWEDRGIGGKLAEDLRARYVCCGPRPALTTDNQGVTAQTLQTLHQFPDRQLVGEDVIWAGYEDGSFLSSHRLVSVMRHQGSGIYGPASNRVVRSRIIADCYCRDGQVVEEWLARDQAAFARCLGIEPEAMARDMVERELRRSGEVGFFTPERDMPGSYRPQNQPGRELDIYREGYARIFEVKETAAIRDLYFHGAAVAIPGGDTVYGHADIDRFVLGYLASFPDAVFRAESSTVNRDEGQPVRLAMRWSLAGTHAGFGHFGEPTGAPVYVMGFSHAFMVERPRDLRVDRHRRGGDLEADLRPRREQSRRVTGSLSPFPDKGHEVLRRSGTQGPTHALGSGAAPGKIACWPRIPDRLSLRYASFQASGKGAECLPPLSRTSSTKCCADPGSICGHLTNLSSGAAPHRRVRVLAHLLGGRPPRVDHFQRKATQWPADPVPVPATHAFACHLDDLSAEKS